MFPQEIFPGLALEKVLLKGTKNRVKDNQTLGENYRTPSGSKDQVASATAPTSPRLPLPNPGGGGDHI